MGSVRRLIRLEPAELFSKFLHDNAPKQNCRLLGLDIGATQIGVAISRIDYQTVDPLTVLKRRVSVDGKTSNIEDIARGLKSLISPEENLTGLVVGYNFKYRQSRVNDDEKKIQVRLMAELSQCLELKDVCYTFWNESLTSLSVDALLKPLEKKNYRAYKYMRDMFSAAEIIQAYLDFQNRCNPYKPFDPSSSSIWTPSTKVLYPPGGSHQISRNFKSWKVEAAEGSKISSDQDTSETKHQQQNPGDVRPTNVLPAKTIVSMPRMEATSAVDASQSLEGGKLLRGLLFCNKSQNGQENAVDPDRKVEAAEGSKISSDQDTSEPKPQQQNPGDVRPTNAVPVNTSVSMPQMEATAGEMNRLEAVDASQTLEGGSPKLSVMLNFEGNGLMNMPHSSNDVPIIVFLQEKSHH